MIENPALLAAVAANPADDLPRLVYADWLDENGDAWRAEFIRVQIELEKNKGTRHEQTLREREEELMAAASDWLGGLDPTSPECTIGFRRGFPETLVVHGHRLTEYADRLAECAPTIRDVSVVGVRNQGVILAQRRFLETVRTLRLEDWPYRHDLEHLAGSPHLSKLRHLSWWIGSRQDEALCRTLSGVRWLPQLDKLELIQLHGGLAAGAMAEDCDANAARCQTICNRARGVTISTVNRAFDAEFTIPERVGQTLFAGTIKGFQRVLIWAGPDRSEDSLYLLTFGPGGHFEDVEPFDSSSLSSMYSCLGFRSGSVKLRAFEMESPSGPIGAHKFAALTGTLVADPDAQNFSFPPGWYALVNDVHTALRSSDFWLRCGTQQYRITANGECIPLY